MFRLAQYLGAITSLTFSLSKAGKIPNAELESIRCLAYLTACQLDLILLKKFVSQGNKSPKISFAVLKSSVCTSKSVIPLSLTICIASFQYSLVKNKSGTTVYSPPRKLIIQCSSKLIGSTFNHFLISFNLCPQYLSS